MKYEKIVGKKKTVEVYRCARCIKRDVEVEMIETTPDPDMGRRMKCPSCGWTSLRPKNAVEDLGVI